MRDVDLPEYLVDDSALTSRQFEVLRSYVRVVLGEAKFREAAAKGTTKPVTVGSYFRTAQQARSNVRQSLATLLIGLWLGVIKAEDVRRLLDLAGSAEREFSEEEAARFITVLRAIMDRVVM